MSGAARGAASRGETLRRKRRGWSPGRRSSTGTSEGDHSEAIPLHSTRLLDRFRALEELKADDQEAVIRLLDAMILKNKVQKTLDLSEARTATG